MTALLQAIQERYELLHKLGEGGMGAVYLVRHRLLGELRVVKVTRALHAEKKQVHERFLREARAATRLRHRNIAQVHDFAVDAAGGAYLVMELIEGITFKELLARQGPPRLAVAIELAIQSLAALGYLHEQGYVHRDVSPDNLMVTREAGGERPLVKLIDLGLAKGPSETLDLTATNVFVGKVRYASPEVFRRPAVQSTAQTDLYAFGVVLYELLTGVCPIRGSSFEELMSAHLLDPPIGFDESDPEERVPEAVRRAVLSTLAKDIEDRPEKAEVLAAALLEARGDEELVFDPSWLPDRPLEVASSGSRPEGGGAEDTTWLETRGFESVTPVTERHTRTAPTIGVADDGAEPKRKKQSVSRSKGQGLRRAVTIAGVLALALAVAWLVQRSDWLGRTRPAAGTAAAGQAVVDALPWARVQSIEDLAGDPVAFGDEGLPRTTPYLVRLPAGRYTARLTHPQVTGTRSLTIDVVAGDLARETASMLPVDVDGYFERAGLETEIERAGSAP